MFFCDDEWHEPVASEVGGMGARACQFEFFTNAIITDATGAPFSANEMKFAAPTAYDSILYWHAAIMLRRKELDSGFLAIHRHITHWESLAVTATVSLGKPSIGAGFT